MRRLLAAVMAALAVLVTASCGSPEKSEWRVVAQGPIVAVDSERGMWVRGSRNHTTSGSYIDYQYAYQEADGALKQGLLSDLYGRYAPYVSGEGAPAHAVSIYQDVGAADLGDPERGPRIIVMVCSLTEEAKHALALPECADPNGRAVPRGVRVEIHVPEGAVIDTEGFTPQEADPGEEAP